MKNFIRNINGQNFNIRCETWVRFAHVKCEIFFDQFYDRFDFWHLACECLSAGTQTFCLGQPFWWWDKIGHKPSHESHEVPSWRTNLWNSGDDLKDIQRRRSTFLPKTKFLVFWVAKFRIQIVIIATACRIFEFREITECCSSTINEELKRNGIRVVQFAISVEFT